MFLLCLVSVGLSASAWFSDISSDGDCREIAGIYSFVETLQNYDNSEVNPRVACTAGIGYLFVSDDCSWQYKLIANEPDRYCLAATGFEERSISHDNGEFWEVPTQGTPLGKSHIGALVFTIERVAGAGSAHGARHIQGLSKTTDGCSLAFSGWAVQRAEIADCYDPTVGRKRHAQLTSAGSSVDVSDVKDALHKIAEALPEWTSDDSSSSSSSSSGPVPCADIAGVYQMTETVNEFDNAKFFPSPFIPISLFGLSGGAPQCNGGVSFLEIREGCGWSYKKVEVGENGALFEKVIEAIFQGTLNPTLDHDEAPLHRCVDDSGLGATGVVEYEGEFCSINRWSTDYAGGDFRFAIDRIEGDADAAVRIHGVLQTSYDAVGARSIINAIGSADLDVFLASLYNLLFGQRGPGCNVAFEGWRVARKELFPCRDRCYTVNNGDFEGGYDGFHSSFTRATPGLVPALGNPDDLVASPQIVGRYAVAANPRLTNALYADLPCDGLCLVSSHIATTTDVAWEEDMRNLGNPACCPSKTYKLSWDAASVGPAPGGATIQPYYCLFGIDLLDTPPVCEPLLGAALVPSAGSFTTYSSLPFRTPWPGELYLVQDTTIVGGAVALDNIRLECWGGGLENANVIDLRLLPFAGNPLK